MWFSYQWIEGFSWGKIPSIFTYPCVHMEIKLRMHLFRQQGWNIKKGTFSELNVSNFRSGSWLPLGPTIHFWASFFTLIAYWATQKFHMNFSITSYGKTWMNFFCQPIGLVIDLFWEQVLYLNSLGGKAVGGGDSKKERLTESLFLKNNQTKLILMPKRHILGWKIFLPYLTDFQ